MKKLSITFAFIMLSVALFTLSIFAADTFVIGTDNIVSSEANATTFGEPIQLFDGNANSAGGWYNSVTSGWCGPNNAEATIVFDKEYEIVAGAIYAWSNSNPGVTITLYDAQGNVTASAFALHWVYTVDGAAFDLGFANVKAKSMTVKMGNGLKYDGNGFRIAEISLTALHIHDYTEPVDDASNVYPTCGVAGSVMHKCSCGDTAMIDVPATGEHAWDEGEITIDPTETTEGLKVYHCTGCDAEKSEKLQPVGHNWDEGTDVPPTCTDKGYTVYKCTDDGCEASYSVEADDALGHAYDDGVITTPATLTAQGEKLYTCTRENCGHSYTEATPLATMADSSFVIGLDNIVHVDEVVKGDYHENRNWQNLFDGKNVNASWSQTTPGGWFGLTGSTLTITFDEEYYVLGVDFYVWSNYNGATIEFFNAAGEKVASYSNNGLEKTNGTAITILECADVLVKSMKISINYQKNDKYGQCLDFQEFVITAHKHVPAEGQEKYDEIEQSCTVNGSYKKFCYICEKEVLVETGVGSHTLDVEVAYPSGYDMNGTKTTFCSTCDYEEVEYLDALICSYGYSVCQTGRVGIIHKFEIDNEAIEVFNSYLASPIEIGVVAASASNFDEFPLTLNEGKVEKVNQRISLIAIENQASPIFEIGIMNLPESAYDLSVVLCAYVSDGKTVSYVGYDGTTEYPEMVAFSQFAQ